MKRWFAAAFGVATITLACAARAEDPAAAEALFREGRSLMANGDLEGACRKFKASQALEASAGTLLNLADCDEKRGRTATAWAEFLAAERLAKAQAKDKQQAEAKRRAAALEPKLVYLTIDVKARAPGLEVRRDGESLDPSVFGQRLPTDPGTHALEATAPGFTPYHADVRVGVAPEGDVVVVPELTPLAAAGVVSTAPVATAPAPVVTSSPAPAPDVTPHASGGGHTVPWVIAGVSGALLVGGSVAGVLALGANSDAKDRCPVANQCTDPEVPDIVHRRDTLALLANVGIGLGVAGLGTAAILAWVVPSKPSETGLHVVPVFGPERAGLSVTERF